MRIALGVLAADAGAVRWDGRAGRPRRPAATSATCRRSAASIPRMQVADQLVYLARLHGMSAAAARRPADAWTERLGVAERRDDDVQKLSLGNQQRVQLAAALVHDPQILVLDEPFSGLDPVAVDVMSGVLREKADQGVPVVFSSHQLDLVQRLCDRVGIVRRGHDGRRRNGRRPAWRRSGPPRGRRTGRATGLGRRHRRRDRPVAHRHAYASRVEPGHGRPGGSPRRAGHRPGARIRPSATRSRRPVPPHRGRRPGGRRRRRPSRRQPTRPSIDRDVASDVEQGVSA